MSIELFEHNQTAYNAAVKMLAETGKAAVIHPTGTGKSFIGFRLCEDNPDKTVCWLSPSEYIFKTQLENIKKTGAEIPQNIKFFTYSKLTFMPEEELSEIRPGFIVLDEFHRCGAEIWGKSVEKLLSVYTGVPVFGLSATNIRYLDNQRDMADELFDGNIASEITLGEAIVRGILPSPVYITALYTYEKDFEKYERRVRNARSLNVREHGEQYLEALRRAIEKADGLDTIFRRHIRSRDSKFIVFCAGREHMEEMVSKVPEWFGEIDSEPKVYTAYSGDPETSKAFADFKADKSGHLKLLFCIDMLNEGVHVDDLDGVILFRPTVSPIVYKQQIGRALTSGDDKMPIIFDIVDNIGSLYCISAIEEEMNEAVQRFWYRGESRYIVNENFRIIDEVRSCREIFEQLDRTLLPSWEIMFSAAENYYRTYGNLYVLSGYHTEEGYALGSWILNMRSIYRGTVKGNLSAEQIKRLESIGMDWLTLHERQWENSYALAKEFYEKNGHLEVPSDNRNLSQWIVRQRQKYRAGQLSGEEIKRLSEIGMIWDPKETWEIAYSAAKKYFEDNRSLDIPAEYITEDGLKLGSWYRMVRNQYRKGELSEERKNRLEQIGINWTSVKLRNWMVKYNEAKAYYEKNGDLNVNNRYVTDSGVKLGVWVSTQRESYAKGYISEEQIKLLEDIGMSWNRFDTLWENGIAHAERYYQKHGDLDCGADYSDSDDFKLGAWLNAQRVKYRNGRLSAHRISVLENMGMVWNISVTAWDRNYEEAKRFFEENGHLRIGKNYVSQNGANINAWLNNMRHKYRTNSLSRDRIAMMEAIGMEWDLLDDSWLSGYEHAKKYFKKHGDLKVPNRYIDEDNFKLKNWLDTAKKAYRNGTLSPNRIAMLESIGMVWNQAEENWKVSVSYLKEYCMKYGNAKVPQTYKAEDGYALGEWLRGKLRQYKNGTLRTDRKNELENIGVVFEGRPAARKADIKNEIRIHP